MNHIIFIRYWYRWKFLKFENQIETFVDYLGLAYHHLFLNFALNLILFYNNNM